MADVVIVSRLAQALVDVMDPLRAAVQSPEAFEALMRREGWQPPPTREYFAAVSDAFKLVGAFENAAAAIESLLDGGEPDPATVLAAIDALVKVIGDIRAIAKPGADLPPPFDRDEFWTIFPSDLVADLFMRYMEVAQPTLFAPLHLLGILDEETVDPAGVPNRLSYVRSKVQWGRLLTLVTDPTSLARDVYGWGTSFDHDKLMRRLERVLLAFGVPVGRYVMHQSLVDRYYGGGTQPDGVRELRVPLVEERRADVGFVRVGLLAVPIPPAAAPADAPVGVFVGPYAYGQAAARVELGGPLALELKGGLESAGDAGLEVRPGAIGAHLGSSGSNLDVEVALALEPNTPLILVGSDDSHRLVLGKGRIALAATGPIASPELKLSLRFDSLSLVINPSDGDSFLTELVGTDEKTAQASGELIWSSQSGLHFNGEASLTLAIPVHASIGGVRLQQIKFEIAAGGQGVSLVTALSGGASIGPVQAALQDVGVKLALTPVTAPARGTFGDLDLQFGFKPPSGVGLAIDVGGLAGGGFLYHDPASATYAGVLQLTLQNNLTLTAYGLVTTKLPDGSSGFSLLIFITADGFKPVALGFGFMLERIGGIVGIHRTFDQEVLRTGLKTDALATLLFPRDPIANAPALIQSMAHAFPAQRGSYLLGLMARITWFTPTLVTFDLALILELGARRRLLALGRASALLPTRDNDLVRLNLDAMGVLDFDAGTLSADAVLVESRLVHQFPITGSAALRACWGDGDGSTQTDFVLSAGGFNPRFTPPAGVPALERVAIALCAGTNPRLVCEAYLAITSNTVQFGACASLYAEALGFSVSGDVGFDALVTLLPPHFIADFHASVQLKRGSHNLFKVGLDGTLEGPLPLTIAAKATFEILWIDFSVHFDFTLAGGRVSQTLPAVAVADELAKALADRTNWTTRRASSVAQGVVLRSLPTSTATVLDPLGQLVVRQQVVPLNASRAIDTFGGAPVSGARTFTVTATLNGQASAPITGAFAPARYFSMSDDEKLAAPSFETMDAGLVLGDGGVTFDATTIVPAPLTYEAITFNPPSATPPTGPPPAPGRYTLPAAALAVQRTSGAAARVPARRVGQTRFATAVTAPAATLDPIDWRIVRNDDGNVAPVDEGVSTWSEYRDRLAALNRGGAKFQMVPVHELV